MAPSLALLSCESSVSVEENPDRKKIINSHYIKIYDNFLRSPALYKKIIIVLHKYAISQSLPYYAIRFEKALKTSTLIRLDFFLAKAAWHVI